MYVPVLLKFIDYWYQERVLQRLKNKFCKMAVCFHELFCENFIVLMKREALAKKNSPWDKISPHCAPPAFGSCWLAWQLSLVGWLAQCASALPRTTDTQWRHKIKEIWANVAGKICFGLTQKFGSGFTAVQWRRFPHRASVVRALCFTKTNANSDLCGGRQLNKLREPP